VGRQVLFRQCNSSDSFASCHPVNFTFQNCSWFVPYHVDKLGVHQQKYKFLFIFSGFFGLFWLSCKLTSPNKPDWYSQSVNCEVLWSSIHDLRHSSTQETPVEQDSHLEKRIVEITWLAFTHLPSKLLMTASISKSTVLYHYDLRFSHASWLTLNWTSKAFCNVSRPAVNTTIYEVGGLAGPAGPFVVKSELI
jgi:hypothetical protein